MICYNTIRKRKGSPVSADDLSQRGVPSGGLRKGRKGSQKTSKKLKKMLDKQTTLCYYSTRKKKEKKKRRLKK
jgi:hypothetical protein